MVVDHILPLDILTHESTFQYCDHREFHLLHITACKYEGIDHLVVNTHEP